MKRIVEAAVAVNNSQTIIKSGYSRSFRPKQKLDQSAKAAKDYDSKDKMLFVVGQHKTLDKCPTNKKFETSRDLMKVSSAQSNSEVHNLENMSDVQKLPHQTTSEQVLLKARKQPTSSTLHAHGDDNQSLMTVEHKAHAAAADQLQPQNHQREPPLRKKTTGKAINGSTTTLKLRITNEGPSTSKTPHSVGSS